MKTVLRVNLQLLPLIVFWVLAPLYPTGAAPLAFLLALIGLAIRFRQSGPKWLEKTEVILLGAFTLAIAGGFHSITASQVPLSFVLLGIVLAGTVLVGKPWTSTYSAAQWGDFAANPLFHRVNQLLSALWAAIFVTIGAARYLQAPPLVYGLLALAGALISIFGPLALIRIQLRKNVLRKDRNRWSPVFLARKTRNDNPDNYDAVIIGAGLGGLTAAALLAQAKLRVIVLEQYSVPGGFCHSWFRQVSSDGMRRRFRFDGGVHDISGVWPGGPVAGLLGKLGLQNEIEWNYLDKSFFNPALGRFDVPRQWAAWVEQLKTKFPGEAEGIQVFTGEVKQIYEALYTESEQHSGVPTPPTTVRGALAFARRFPLAVKWMDRPFGELLNHRIAHPELRRHFLALSGYITSEPSRITVGDMVPLFGYFLHGGNYPIGGSSKLANALVSAIDRENGRVKLRAAVTKILVEAGQVTGVVDDAGQTYWTNVVVAAGDFLETTQNLVDQDDWPASFRRIISQRTPSASAFSVHLGIKGELIGVQPVNHIEMENGSIDLIVPSLVDPSAAPEGHHCVELIRIVNRQEATSWFPSGADEGACRRTPIYKQKKRDLAAELISLGEQVIPNLASRIVFQCESSPLTFRRYSWTRAGCIYGVELGDEPVEIKSPIRGLCFTGSVLLGGGVEAVMIAGARTAEKLCPGILAADQPVMATVGTSSVPVPDLAVTPVGTTGVLTHG